MMLLQKQVCFIIEHKSKSDVVMNVWLFETEASLRVSLSSSGHNLLLYPREAGHVFEAFEGVRPEFQCCKV